ncbi:hypothetical protein BGZ97_002173 [Linnemannia gamsii]|uniref:Methyltransferase domain-containing protein n=1 Tax=Linnemannia gamsii TaxID=64522 RepID=A0A9P6RIH8_9FUNG|nr:hypothetical protein BGZ97_002173 [Linnemannia gamsii]
MPDVISNSIKENIIKSGVDPRTISYIEASAPGYEIGDVLEVFATEQVFREFTQDQQFCALGSLKPSIGHATAASGYGNFYAGAIIEEYCFEENSDLREAQQIECITTEQVIILSAKTTEHLKAMIEQLWQFTQSQSQFLLQDMAYTLQLGRVAMPLRWAAVYVRENLISHSADTQDFSKDFLRSVEARLREMGDMPGFTVEQQIRLLKDLASFDLVTHISGQTSTHQMSDLEYQILEKFPMILATRERFGIFRQQLQARLKPGLTLASVPCGIMGELLLLDYGSNPNINLIGVDLDRQALNGAQAEAEKRGLASYLSLRREDAWDLSLSQEVDILASNGLNIYEPDDTRVTALYRTFFNALKPGGTLITSFITPPPPKESPWNLAELDQKSLSLQALLSLRLIEGRWSAFRTHAQTKAQLEEAGFTDITFIDDRARIMPTVLAQKPLKGGPEELVP